MHIDAVDEILLPKYVNWSTNFRGFVFNEEIAPSVLKLMNSVLSEFSLLLPAPGSVADIRLERVYLQEALDHYASSQNLNCRIERRFIYGQKRGARGVMVIVVGNGHGD